MTEYISCSDTFPDVLIKLKWNFDILKEGAASKLGLQWYGGLVLSTEVNGGQDELVAFKGKLGGHFSTIIKSNIPCHITHLYSPPTPFIYL